MVEKYKRESIDIVLGSRKCIYTDEKNKKFIKQNKKYIPIVKRKGKYAIINKKGGGLESSKIKKDINILNEKIESNNAKIYDINYKSTKEPSYDDEDRIRRIVSENTNMLLSVDEKVEQYEKQLLLEKEGNVKGKLHDDIPENKTHNTIEDEKAVIEKNNLKTDIETHNKNIKQLNIELTKNVEDRASFLIELNKKPQKSGFFSDNTTQRFLKLDSSIKQLSAEILKITRKISIESMEKKEKSKKLKELEKQEEWKRNPPNFEKEQFLKEITEKETLIKSLEKYQRKYINKINMEEKYLDNYLKEQNKDIRLDYYNITIETYPFLLELLLKKITDLEKRIKS